MYGKDGKQFMELRAGIGVSNVGHRHPKVVEAIHNKVDKYLNLMVYGEYVQTPQVLLAEALVKIKRWDGRCSPASRSRI